MMRPPISDSVSQTAAVRPTDDVVSCAPVIRVWDKTRSRRTVTEDSWNGRLQPILSVHRRPYHSKQIEVATLDKKWLDELAVVELDRETNSACTQIKLTSDPRVTDTHPYWPT